MTVTFDSTTLTSPSPSKPKQSAESFEITIECLTDTFTDISALVAKAGVAHKTTLLSGEVAIQTTGTKGSLVIEGVTYTNCVIMDGVQWEEVEGTGGTWWKYRATFAQETK